MPCDYRSSWKKVSVSLDNFASDSIVEEAVCNASVGPLNDDMIVFRIIAFGYSAVDNGNTCHLKAQNEIVVTHFLVVITGYYAKESIRWLLFVTKCGFTTCLNYVYLRVV